MCKTKKMSLRRFTNSESRNEIIKTIKRCGFNINESFRFNINLSLCLIKKTDETKSRQQYNFWTPKSNETHMALEGVYYNNSYKVIIHTNLHLISKNILIYKADEHMELNIYRIDDGIINEIHTCNIPFQLCYSDVYLGFSDFYVYYDDNKSTLTGVFSKNDLLSCLNKPGLGFSTNRFIDRIENEIKWVTSSIKLPVAVSLHECENYNKSENINELEYTNQNLDNNTELYNSYYIFPQVPTKMPEYASAPPISLFSEPPPYNSNLSQIKYKEVCSS